MNFNLKGEQSKSCDRRSNETHTPFTILNQNFYEMDLIWFVRENGKLGTERLHDDYRKMLKPINLFIENRFTIHIAYF